MLENIKDIIFPPRCAVCDAVIPPGQKGMCSSCRMKLSYISEPRCMKCGKEIEDETEEYCDDCSKTKRCYEQGFPLFNYVPPLSDAITRLKYHGRQEYAAVYGREIATEYGKAFKRLGVECFVPVPLHSKRLKKRGYNQAALIAEAISKETGIPVNEKLLIRSKNTAPQKELNDTDREKNLLSAFAIGMTNSDKDDKKRGGSKYVMDKEIQNAANGAVRDRSEIPGVVMLVDDIYTTGATIEGCTKVLLAAGVNKVYYTSVAIGRV